jgi:hypothetical protein
MIRQAGHPLVKSGAGAVVFGNHDMIDESLPPALRAASVAVWSGVPAVVAPLRPLEPETASRFAEELYNGLNGGLTLEAALGEARLHLAAQASDWSAYCLRARGRRPHDQDSAIPHP